MTRRIVLLVAVAATALLVNMSVAGADSTPTGERVFHQASIEPAYDAANAGQLGFLLTPTHVPDPVKASPQSWKPIYLPVYPTTTTVTTTLNCMHVPVENCPSHGDLVAGAAQGISQANGFGSVYSGGVLGHDHVLDFPGGDDFNPNWEPVLVLFKTPAAANQHLVTDAAILDAAAKGDVMLVPAPNLTFLCLVVPATIWNHATP